MSNKDVFYSVNECLVTRFSEELSEMSQVNLAKAIIVLPNKRLEVALTERLTGRLGSTFFPTVFSIDEFIIEGIRNISAALPKLQKFLHTKKISSVSEEIILEKLIVSNDFKYLKSGHEHEISVFLKSLVVNKMYDSWYKSALEVIENDQSRSDVPLFLAKNRVDEVNKLFELYSDYLFEHTISCASFSLAMQMELLNEFEESFYSWVNRQSVYFFGFTTIQPVYKELLEGLSKIDTFKIRLPNTPYLYSKINPIAELLSYAGHSLKGAEKDDSGFNNSVEIVKCSTTLDEAFTSLKIAEKAISNGVNPSSIAILVSDEKSYAPLFSSLVKEFDFDINLALPLSLSDTVFGDFIKSLDEFYKSEQNADDYYHLLLNRLIFDRLNNCLFSNSGFEIVNLPHLLSKTLNNFDQSKKIWELIESNDLLKKIHSSLSEQLGEYYNGLSKSGSISLDVAKSLSLSISEEITIEKVDADILSSMKAGIDSVFSSFEVSSESEYEFGQFISLLSDKLPLIPVRRVGYPLKGVQITSVIESRFIPFEVAIICGATEGDFPKSLPNDVVIDNLIKTKIGLPSWAYVESMEDTTFTLLWKRVKNLKILYPEYKDSNLTVRSRFVDRVLIENHEALEYNGYSYRAKEFAPLREVDANQFLGEFGENARSLLKKLSPSSLEKLIRCPYKFLMSKLGVYSINNLEDEYLLRQGTWMHLVVELLFKGVGDQPQLNCDFSEIPEDLKSPLENSKLNNKEYLLNRISQISDILFDKVHIDYPSFYHIKNIGFPKFIDWLVLVNESNGGIKKVLSEYNVESLKSVFELKDDISFEVKGIVDSIFMFNDFSLFIDYKTNTTPAAAEIRNGLSPQLLIYAYALSDSKEFKDVKLSNIVLSYWKFTDACLEIAARSEELSPKLELGAKNSKKPTVEATIKNVVKVVNWRIDEILRTGRFEPDVGKGCGYCDYANLCRKNDPFYQDRLEKSVRLDTEIDVITAAN